MHKWALTLLLILSLLIPVAVHAQNPLTLSSLEIDLWPEYDKPSMLVIYRMTLSATTPFPASLSVRIPVAAGEPYAVAAGQVVDSLYTIGYTRQVVGDWAVINFTTTAPEIELDYYDPGLIKDGTARHFKYEWPGDYAVTALTIQVQQPIGATDMRISPSLGTGVTGGNGLTYYSQNIGAISSGQTIQILVDYQKSTDTLSAENMSVQPSAPIPQSATQNLNLSQWLPWILGIVGAALIIGGGVWFWQSGKQRPAPFRRQRRSRAASREAEVSPGAAEDGVYCSQCGKRALPGDRFCRSCGTPIRIK